MNIMINKCLAVCLKNKNMHGKLYVIHNGSYWNVSALIRLHKSVGEKSESELYFWVWDYFIPLRCQPKTELVSHKGLVFLQESLDCNSSHLLSVRLLLNLLPAGIHLNWHCCLCWSWWICKSSELKTVNCLLRQQLRADKYYPLIGLWNVPL